MLNLLIVKAIVAMQFTIYRCYAFVIITRCHGFSAAGARNHHCAHHSYRAHHFLLLQTQKQVLKCLIFYIFSALLIVAFFTFEQRTDNSCS